jgi:hypothetical protein
MLEGGLQAVQADKVDILKRALDVAQIKNPTLQLPSWIDPSAASQ